MEDIAGALQPNVVATSSTCTVLTTGLPKRSRRRIGLLRPRPSPSRRRLPPSSTRGQCGRPQCCTAPATVPCSASRAYDALRRRVLTSLRWSSYWYLRCLNAKPNGNDDRTTPRRQVVATLVAPETRIYSFGDMARVSSQLWASDSTRIGRSVGHSYPSSSVPALITIPHSQDQRAPRASRDGTTLAVFLEIGSSDVPTTSRPGASS